MAATFIAGLVDKLPSPQPSVMSSPPLETDVSKVERVFMVFREAVERVYREQSLELDSRMFLDLETSKNAFIRFVKAGEAFDLMKAQSFFYDPTIVQEVGISQVNVVEEFQAMENQIIALSEPILPPKELLSLPDVPIYASRREAMRLNWEKKDRQRMALQPLVEQLFRNLCAIQSFSGCV